MRFVHALCFIGPAQASSTNGLEVHALQLKRPSLPSCSQTSAVLFTRQGRLRQEGMVTENNTREAIVSIEIKITLLAALEMHLYWSIGRQLFCPCKQCTNALPVAQMKQAASSRWHRQRLQIHRHLQPSGLQMGGAMENEGVCARSAFCTCTAI